MLPECSECSGTWWRHHFLGLVVEISSAIIEFWGSIIFSSQGATRVRQAAFTMFVMSYNEVRAAVQYLRRRENDANTEPWRLVYATPAMGPRCSRGYRGSSF